MVAKKKLGEKVDTSTCILWTKAKNGGGYPIIWHNGKARMAIRVWWEQETGKPIPKGRCVCHKCDNPSCINPDHLFLGSYSDNLRDMHLKGRSNHARGVNHGLSKLTPEKVREIRRKYDMGARIKELHREYDCARTTIHKVVYGITWRHIK